MGWHTLPNTQLKYSSILDRKLCGYWKCDGKLVQLCAWLSCFSQHIRRWNKLKVQYCMLNSGEEAYWKINAAIRTAYFYPQHNKATRYHPACCLCCGSMRFGTMRTYLEDTLSCCQALEFLLTESPSLMSPGGRGDCAACMRSRGDVEPTKVEPALRTLRKSAGCARRDPNPCSPG